MFFLLLLLGELGLVLLASSVLLFDYVHLELTGELAVTWLG